MARFIFIILAVTLFPFQACACEKLSELNWLLGSWAKKDENKLILENWIKESESKFSALGVSSSKNDQSDRPPFFEFLSIEVIGSEIFYVAKPPQNKFPTAFKAVTCSKSEVSFENKDHDFPKKLIYRKISGSKLEVDVLGANDKGFQLSYLRLKEKSNNTEKLVTEYVEAFNQKLLDKMLALADENIAWFSVNSKGQKIETANKSELAESMKSYFNSSFSSQSKLLNVKVWETFLLATEKAIWVKDGSTRSQCSNVVYQVDAEKIRRVWYYPAKKCSESLL